MRRSKQPCKQCAERAPQRERSARGEAERRAEQHREPGGTVRQKCEGRCRAKTVIARLFGLSRGSTIPLTSVTGRAGPWPAFGGPLRAMRHASHSRYAEPSAFTAVCSAGIASNRLASPSAATAASNARPVPIPSISGIERAKPKRAPDAVASVVAPPGVTVATATNSKSGRMEEVIGVHPGDRALHCTDLRRIIKTNIIDAIHYAA